jgi:hypothetical protein
MPGVGRHGKRWFALDPVPPHMAVSFKYGAEAFAMIGNRVRPDQMGRPQRAVPGLRLTRRGGARRSAGRLDAGGGRRRTRQARHRFGRGSRPHDTSRARVPCGRSGTSGRRRGGSEPAEAGDTEVRPTPLVPLRARELRRRRDSTSSHRHAPRSGSACTVPGAGSRSTVRRCSATGRLRVRAASGPSRRTFSAGA